MTETATANIEFAQLASEITARINNLDSLFDQSLRFEMDDLKKVLKENANAAALLKDEDIGVLVKNLQRTVSDAHKEAVKTPEKKTRGKKKETMSMEELEAELAKEGL